LFHAAKITLNSFMQQAFGVQLRAVFDHVVPEENMVHEPAP